MQNLIIHIPHASTAIPSYEGFIADKTVIEKEIKKLTDHFTEELFGHADLNQQVVKANFSRVFCDVERYEDDNKESMAKYGMGVTYTTTDCGQPLRELSEDEKESILRNYYRPHHLKLNDAVETTLRNNQCVSILDAHSFSNIPFHRDLDKSPERPDFCIGTNVHHTPDLWIEKAKEFFNTRGYSLGINSPYSGTIVPLSFYKVTRVKSIMLEVNRSLYMDEESVQKNTEFEKIRSLIRNFILEVLDGPVL